MSNINENVSEACPIIKLSPSKIYLASPYSHPDSNIREERFLDACKAAANLMRSGSLVFSPIAHSHNMADFFLPRDFWYWREWCLSFLDRWATCFYILKLEGWNESVGIKAEWDYAVRKGVPVTFLEPAFVGK